MAQFEDLFRVSGQTRVLDNGGSEFNWGLASCDPQLTILNLGFNRLPANGASYVAGDARRLPFHAKSFDIVYSNSVIEHVGNKGDIQAFANEVRRVGRAYYVQTPNRWFLVEPHYLAPLIHFLPKRWHKKLIRYCSVWGWLNRPSAHEAERFADGINLLTRADMKSLFPDAIILRERALGLTKSFIAARAANLASQPSPATSHDNKLHEMTMPAAAQLLPPKYSVLGVGISATTYEGVTGACRRWVEQRRASGFRSGSRASPPGRYVTVTSVHGIVTAVRNARFRAVLNGADIATPDGMPVVWALRSFGAAGQSRVYGPSAMLKICEQAARLGHRVFLYGGRPETLPVLRRRLKKRFRGLMLAGSYSPPFRALTAAEDAKCTRMILDSGADIVFVGISTPKQEIWMAEHRHKLPGIVMLGVGAAFDFHAGRVRQAPGWMQRAGLEWLFRLAMEPGRLWRRYILETPLFLPLWALQKAGILKYR